MLRDTVLNAVTAARVALGDLLVPVTVTRRTPQAHVPGTAVQYDTIQFSCQMAILDYEENEIDGTRILRTDQQGLILGEEIQQIKVNDTIDDSGTLYRVCNRNPFRVGTSTAAVQLQLRPL